MNSADRAIRDRTGKGVAVFNMSVSLVAVLDPVVERSNPNALNQPDLGVEFGAIVMVLVPVVVYVCGTPGLPTLLDPLAVVVTPSPQLIDQLYDIAAPNPPSVPFVPCDVGIEKFVFTAGIFTVN
jgi:hypothetical protein